MNNKALAKGLAKISVAVLVLSLVAFSLVKVVLPVLGGAAAISTDKPDYAPEETVTIYGSGFLPDAVVTVTVTRPDGSVNPPAWTVTSDGSGSFTTTYLLDGITGTYTIDATDGTNSAQTTFTDTSPSVYTIIIQTPTNSSTVLNPVHVSGTWDVQHAQGQLSDYNVQIAWGDGSFTNAVNVVRHSSGSGSDKHYWGTFDTNPGFDHTYASNLCQGVTLIAKLYHSQPPGAEAGDASAGATIVPGTSEVCTDGIDNNCNGLIDCADPDCTSAQSCVPVCGNGVVESGEQCDPGANNPADCCAANCQFETSAYTCRASDGACDVAETCSGSSATCPSDSVRSNGYVCAYEPGQCDANDICNGASKLCNEQYAPSGTTCSDSNACTTGETCNGAGACTGGSTVSCNDGNVCTDDSCNPATGCGHTYNTASCDDSNKCTTVDTCALGVCAGTPKNCDDGNACTTDSCNPANGDCTHSTGSDLTGPVTSNVVVLPSFNNGVFNLTATATDTCSNIQTSKYFVGHGGLGYCDGVPSADYVVGTMDPVDGSYNSPIENVYKNNLNLFRDGVNFACVESQDQHGNWGNCACAYMDTDILPPSCSYNVYLGNYVNPSNHLICGGSFTINATVCDTQSNIQGGEYFIDTQIPPVPAPWTGVWMTNLTRFVRPTDGSLCAVINATVDASHLQDGLHTIALRGKDAVENWAKIENCQAFSFITDGTAPSTSKTLTPYDGKQQECSQSDISGANLSDSLTNGCAFVKAGTTVTLHPSDSGSRVYWTVLYKVNPGDEFAIDQQGVGSLGQDVIITLNKDSYHLIVYYSVDSCGNTEAAHYELDIVDTKAPVTTKTIEGTQLAGAGFTWITKDTTITLSCADQQPHPSDHVTLYAKYNVDGGGEWQTIPTEGGYARFSFKEDSNHTLKWHCVDALGNSEEEHTEVDKVDTTAPVTTKTYGTPLVEAVTGGYPKWITSQTQITLSPVDGGEICASGVAHTYWRNTLLGSNDACNNPSICQETTGSGDWHTYTVPFTKPEESCHLIEYYSVDALNNTETVKKQCVFVDNSAPVSQKVLGTPKHACNATEQSMYYPDMAAPTDGCNFITQQTSITINCADQQPHPVGGETIKYKYYLLGSEPETWTTVAGTQASVTSHEDSAHVLKWQCVDALGNTEALHSEYDIVDTAAPVSAIQIVGPIFSSDEKTYLDGVSNVSLSCADQQPHPSDHVQIYYKYKVEDGSYSEWTLYTAPFGFPEESMHTLQFYCVDALNNQEEPHTQVYFVDHTKPVTIKEYGTPIFSNATAEWINSSTPITLTATDGTSDHASGVAATYYRVSLVDDRYCTGTEEWNCASAVGSGAFITYANPFTIAGQSCHLIEYYSVDHVGKTEETNKQCAFVDNSAPAAVKTVGKPNTKWDGSDAVYYDIAGKCWNGQSDSIDCWKVTTMTPVYMSCVDPQPHPVGNAQTCFSVGLDGSADTSSYCEQFHGNMQQNGFCCVDSSATLGIMFKEETEHELEYYCKDALGNTGSLDVEKFKVQGTSFNITLNKKWNLISVPFVMLDGSIDAAFADIKDKVIGVWTYDAAADTWYVYKPNGPNTIHQMVPGWGYWVLMNESAMLNIGGSLFSPAQTPPQKQLVHGWNLIGYYGTDGLLNYTGPFGSGRTSYCALQSLVDTQIGYPRWSSLVTYWQLKSSPSPWPWEYLGTADKMDPGAGYWLEIDVPDTYTFSTTCGLV